LRQRSSSCQWNAARIHEQAVVAEKTLLIADLKPLVAKLEGQVAQHKRAMFGPKSEKLAPAQLQLALEDIETAIAETREEIAKVEDKIDNLDDPEKKVPREPRKPRALPENLPRLERVIEGDIEAGAQPLAVIKVCNVDKTALRISRRNVCSQP
jgi:transposase